MCPAAAQASPGSGEGVGVEAVSEAVRWVQNIAYIAVGLWALARWRRFGTEASAWLAATFGTIGAAVTVAVVATEVTGSEELPAWLVGPIVGLIVVFPYFLVRFLHAFEAVPGWIRRTAAVLCAAAVAGGFVIDLPAPDEPQTTLSTLYTLGIVLTWVAVLPYVAVRFWRAGRAQPTPARRRMYALAIGVVLLVVSIAQSGVNADPSPTVTLANQFIALAAAGAFLLGIAPPRPVRTLWRQPEEDRIGQASLELLQAETAREVATVVAPLMQHVVAADRVVLRHRGRSLADTGPDREATAGQEPIVVEMSDGAVQVWPSRYTPFFGSDELDVLERIGRLADLALARTTLLDSERAARAEVESVNEELEDVNAELEAFVYSASHDLKSPTIAILSYVEILAEDYGHLLDEEGRYFLDRMRSNGAYMEALVRDLLELSRVGRRDTTPEHVDLDELLPRIVSDVTDTDIDLEVAPLPDLYVNGLRVRQLFQNLFTNAAKHSGRDGVRIEVEVDEAAPGPGVTVLVRDDGQGIAQEYGERIFGVFEQLEVDENRDGTGMGLAICRKIIESFGGSIHLTDHDGGAEFALQFPPTALAANADVAPQEVPA